MAHSFNESGHAETSPLNLRPDRSATETPKDSDIYKVSTCTSTNKTVKHKGSVQIAETRGPIIALNLTWAKKAVDKSLLDLTVFDSSASS